MNKKFLLSTVFMLMSWQGAFAGAPEFSGTPEGQVKPRVAMTAQPQGLLMGNMTPDTMMGILKNLPFKDGWKLLSVNKFHHDHVEVWEIFANIHGTSITEGGDTAEKIRGKLRVIEITKSIFRSYIQSLNPVTSEMIENVLSLAQNTPFLGGVVIESLSKKAYPHLSIPASQEKICRDAQFGLNLFLSVSMEKRRAYVMSVAARTNPDGTPGLGAENAQKYLIMSAYTLASLGFTPDLGTPTSGCDYLEGVAARKNPDGTPGFGAEEAQIQLNALASLARHYFRDDRGTPNSAYDYLVKVAARVNPDGTPGLGAEDAQMKLNDAAYKNRGALGFKGARGKPTSGYDYLVWISERMNPDGTPGLGAEHAKKLLARFS